MRAKRSRPCIPGHCALLAILCLALAAKQAAAQPCTPTFPTEQGQLLGWQGGDAAYSIPLPDGRDVWIFGDTLYGPHRVVEGNQPKMVHNSLGISTCKDGHWQLKYVVKHDDTGKAISYFSPSRPDHWYWAMDGFYAKGDLWITLLCIRHTSKP